MRKVVRKFGGGILALALETALCLMPLTGVDVWADTATIDYTSVLADDGELYLANMGSIYQNVVHAHTANGTVSSNCCNNPGGCYTQAFTHHHTDSCYSITRHHGSFSWDGYASDVDPVTGEPVGNWSTGGWVDCEWCDASTYHIEHGSGPNGSGSCSVDWEDRRLTCPLYDGTVYSLNCGKTPGVTVVAKVNVHLDEDTGEMVFAINDQGDSCNDTAISWTIKVYTIDDQLLETKSLTGETVRVEIQQPKYSASVVIREKTGAAHTVNIPTYIASIFNLRYLSDANKPLNIYLDGTKLRAIYYCHDGNEALMATRDRRYLMFGY